MRAPEIGVGGHAGLWRSTGLYPQVCERAGTLVGG